MLRLLSFVALFSSVVVSQVRVSTGGEEFKSHQQIPVMISNAGKNNVSYCVEFGQWSLKTGSGEADDIEATPIPFYVQKQSGGKWGILLIGTDVGSSRHAVVLKAGESQQFPFRLGDRGRMRLVLGYWRGENDNVCKFPKGKKTARSKIFLVN
jgi:hypothetical protein